MTSLGIFDPSASVPPHRGVVPGASHISPGVSHISTGRFKPLPNTIDINGFDTRDADDIRLQTAYQAINAQISADFDRYKEALDALNISRDQLPYTVFLVDISGSMQNKFGSLGTRIETMQYFSVLLARLAEYIGVPVCVYTFGDNQKQVWGWGDIQDAKTARTIPAKIMRATDSTKLEGTTDLGSALCSAHDELSTFSADHPCTQRKPHIMIFTDGIPSDKTYHGELKKLQTQNVPVTVFRVGSDKVSLKGVDKSDVFEVPGDLNTQFIATMFSRLLDPRGVKNITQGILSRLVNILQP